jgi:predicted Zn-dependent protease
MNVTSQREMVVVNLCDSLLESGKFDDVPKYLEFIRNINLNPTVLYVRARYYRETGKRSEAENDLRRILELEPKAEKASIELSDFMIDQNKPEEALKLLAPHVAAGSTDPNVWLKKAIAHRFLGQSTEEAAANETAKRLLLEIERRNEKKN